MEWWLVILFLLGGLLVLLAMGMPVAFSFLLVNLLGAFFFMGGVAGLNQATQQIFTSLTTFTLAPVPLFIFMGEVIFHSGIGSRTLDVLDKWLGRLPGRLSLMVIAGGTIFSALSGSTIANTAMLGAIMVPEMTARGYKKPMTLGPIVGVGGLAMLIPPSALAVVLASLAQISVGKVLIAGAIPGVMIGMLYLTYVVGRCYLNPSLAPAYDITSPPLSERLRSFAQYVLPLVVIVFLVLGVIFLGIATPTEAAATGALGSLILAASYKRLNIEMLKKSLGATLEIVVMVFMIVAASKTYSSILAFTGASQGMVQFVVNQALPSLLILIAMQFVILVFGTFMEQVSIMMIVIPMYMPIIYALGFDPIWFAVLMLLNLEMALSTPPFGLLLFVMKGAAPPGTTLGDIIRAALPFLACDLIAMVILIAFPAIALFLPNLMK
ncbi:MAG: TRAP transporter large permease subunit [Dehalococcoidia bacterium]|nr:TRAP transporter large permease subunit [Dehalococcoidia bacterium]